MFPNGLQMVYIGQRSQVLVSLLAISQSPVTSSKKLFSRYHLRPTESESLGMGPGVSMFCSAYGEWGEVGVNY